MERARRFLFASMIAAAASLAAPPAAQADDATVYVVTYLEVAPASAGEAQALLTRYGQASRQEAGVLRFETLHRRDRANHFAVVEAWQDQKAREAHVAAAPTVQFREKLHPLLSAGYDERAHIALSVGSRPAAPAARGAIYVVTHVDIIPTFKDKGIAMVKALAEASRHDAGNLRFDALTQGNRPNHMTLVEIWKDQAALDGHTVTPAMKKFREELLPMSGSLFDERLYGAME